MIIGLRQTLKVFISLVSLTFRGLPRLCKLSSLVLEEGRVLQIRRVFVIVLRIVKLVLVQLVHYLPSFPRVDKNEIVNAHPVRLIAAAVLVFLLLTLIQSFQ